MTEKQIEKIANKHFKGLLVTEFGKKVEVMGFLQLDCLAKDIMKQMKKEKPASGITKKEFEKIYSFILKRKQGGYDIKNKIKGFPNLVDYIHVGKLLTFIEKLRIDL